MCPHHYHGYCDDAEDMIPGLPDDDDTEHPENVQNEEDPEIYDEEEEEKSDVNDSEISSEGGGWWPTCEECGAAEETRPFPNKGWICIDCKDRSGNVEPAPEPDYAPSDVEYKPPAEAEYGLEEPEIENDPQGEDDEPQADENKATDDENDDNACDSEPEAKRRRI